MIIAIALALLLAMGALLSSAPIAQASTDGDSEGGDEGESNEEESTEQEGTEEESGADDGGDAITNPSCGSGDCEAVPSEPAPNDDDDDEPLPYCDTGASPCHDIDDIDKDTGKYPCNDGTQRTNKEDCPDATKPVLPRNPFFEIVGDFGTFSVQGSSGPSEQTGLIPIPKPGEAVLKIIYDDEWTGNILDSNNTSISYDGDGNYSIVFPCAEDDDFNLPGFYSLSVQKSDDDNEVLQLVVQNHANQTLDQGQTTAEFGIVSLSGECEIS